MQPPPKTALIEALRASLGTAHVLQADASDPLERHLVDWRQRYRGQALAVVRPGSTEQVAMVVRLCAEHGVSIVPQGGNTGLVGGSVPDASGRQVLLHLGRLRAVRQVDVDNQSMVLEAGCTLREAQATAESHGLLFPLRLASEGSCTVGGVLATNAGGTQVLRYGTARELCLGLEVVTAQGQVWHGLQGLRKNNSGYDLRDLMVGSEGTLGIITAATLKLHPAATGTTTALLACDGPEAAVHLLRRCRQALDAGLTAFELMAPLPLRLVQHHLPDAARVLHTWCPTGQPMPHWLVLLELTHTRDEQLGSQALHTVLSTAMADGLVHAQALLSSQGAQQSAMWSLREAIPLAEKCEGVLVKHDIGLPTSTVASFLQTMASTLEQRWPGARPVCFGHLGDGNLHYNVQAPSSVGMQPRPGAAFEAFEAEVNDAVFDMVLALGGTLSAEHGIGALRASQLASRHDPVALGMMRSIKQALDPAGTLNPGRVLP